MRERKETCSTDQAGETTSPGTSGPDNMSGDNGRLKGLALLLKAGAVYFLVAFGAGFVFEIIRLQVVALHVSERSAAVPVLFISLSHLERVSFLRSFGFKWWPCMSVSEAPQ